MYCHNWLTEFSLILWGCCLFIYFFIFQYIFISIFVYTFLFLKMTKLIIFVDDVFSERKSRKINILLFIFHKCYWEALSIYLSMFLNIHTNKIMYTSLIPSTITPFGIRNVKSSVRFWFPPHTFLWSFYEIISFVENPVWKLVAEVNYLHLITIWKSCLNSIFTTELKI